ncbi:PAS domain-containing protein [Fusibacter bizertensis]
MAIFVFFIKLSVAMYILYKLIIKAIFDKREKNTWLIIGVSFIVLTDLRNLFIGAIPSNLVSELAVLFFLIYFLSKLIGDRSSLSSFMRNFVDVKTLFESEIIENLEEGIALIRSDTLDILASNQAFQVVFGTNYSFILLADIVSALLRGDDQFEITDYNNNKKILQSRLVGYGRKYAILYFKDISDLAHNKDLVRESLKEVLYNWDNTSSLIMVRSLSGDIIYVNESMANFLHKSAHNLVDQHFSSIYNNETEKMKHIAINRDITEGIVSSFKGILKYTYQLQTVGYFQCEEQLITYNGNRHILTTGADITQSYILQVLTQSFQEIHGNNKNLQHATYVVADLIHYDILFKERLYKFLPNQIASLSMFISGLNEEDKLYFTDVIHDKQDFFSKTICYNDIFHFNVEKCIRSSNGDLLGVTMKYINPESMTNNLPVIGTMILNHIREGIIVVNRQGTIEYSNEMMLRILNYENVVLVGKSILDISLGLTKEMLDRNMELTQEHSSLHFERIYLTRDGYKVPTEVIAMNMEYINDDKMLLLVRDISEKFIYKKRLVDSQSRYAQIFESLQDSVLEIKLPEKIVSFYREFDSEKGLIGMEISFLQWLNSISDQDRSIVYEAIDIITSEKSDHYVFEYRYFKNSGWEWFRATGKYIVSNDGASVIIINQNISEIKNVIQKLEESKIILEESEKIANISHWKFRVSKNLFSVSSTFVTIFDLKENIDEIYYDNLVELIYPLDTDYFEYKFHRFIWNKEALDIVVRFHTHGRIIFVNFIGQVYYDDENMPVYAIGSMGNVTEKMNSRQRFEESRMLLEHVVEQAPYGIIIIRNNGSVDKINQGAVELLKLETEQNACDTIERLTLHLKNQFCDYEVKQLDKLTEIYPISEHDNLSFNITDRVEHYHLKVTTSNMYDADNRFIGKIMNIIQL